MTKEEFSLYLKEIDGIYDWKGRKLTNPFSFGVKQGWFEILRDLFNELIELGWDKHLYYIKEKFGGLRVALGKDNLDSLPEGTTQIITKYENLSYTICEECGDIGELRSGDWLKTLCDEHSNGREPFDKEQFKRLGL